MLMPCVFARVKQRYRAAGFGISPVEMIALPDIASATGQSPVRSFVTNSRCRINVFNFEREIENDLGRATVFAPVSGHFCHLGIMRIHWFSS